MSDKGLKIGINASPPPTVAEVKFALATGAYPPRNPPQAESYVTFYDPEKEQMKQRIAALEAWLSAIEERVNALDGKDGAA